MLQDRFMTTADLAELVRDAVAKMSGRFGVIAVAGQVSKQLRPHDDDVVRYACGLFDGPKCLGTAEAAGSCRPTDADGNPVDLAAALEPFRLRG